MPEYQVEIEQTRRGYVTVRARDEEAAEEKVRVFIDAETVEDKIEEEEHDDWDVVEANEV